MLLQYIYTLWKYLLEYQEFSACYPHILVIILHWQKAVQMFIRSAGASRLFLLLFKQKIDRSAVLLIFVECFVHQRHPAAHLCVCYQNSYTDFSKCCLRQVSYRKTTNIGLKQVFSPSGAWSLTLKVLFCSTVKVCLLYFHDSWLFTFSKIFNSKTQALK